MTDLTENDITAKNFKKFYDSIYPYLGANPALNYSLEEKVVGTWIDGKPVYQKVVDCGALPNATTKNVAHGISNFKHAVSINGIAFDSVYSIPLIYATSNNATENIEIWINDTTLSIKTSINKSNYTSSYVTLRYTKTTD